METVEQQIKLETANAASATATATNENNQHNPGLRALLSLRNCNITLEKEYGDPHQAPDSCPVSSCY